MGFAQSVGPRTFAYPLLFITVISILLIVFHNQFHLGGLSEIIYRCPKSGAKAIQPEFLGPHVRWFHAPDDESADVPGAHTLLDDARLSLNGGFLRLREPSGRVGFYGVSMFHQLHCVQMLRNHITGNASGHGNHQGHGRSKRHGNDHGRKIVQDELTPDHLVHCLDYLAQAIACVADDTVEPARIQEVDGGYHVAIIDGLNAAHHCRDARALNEAVEGSESNPIDIIELEAGATVAALQK